MHCVSAGAVGLSSNRALAALVERGAMAELFPMLCLALGAARVEPGAVAELVPVL